MRKFFTTLAIISGLAAITAASAHWNGFPPPPVEANPFSPEDLEKFFQRDKLEEEYARAAVVAASVFEQNGFNPWLSERVARHAVDSHLPVRLVAADVIVESSARANAVSTAGAVGVMQVMPRLWHVTSAELKDPDTNLRVGTKILSRHVRAYGIRDGLRHYYGVTEGSTASEEYADRVLAVARMR